MEKIVALVIPVIFSFFLVSILLKPIKLIFKLLINTGFGFICLFLLNLLSDYTGVVFSLNFVTAAIVGILGLPGIVILLIYQLYL